jgi:hypothetical protein
MLGLLEEEKEEKSVAANAKFEHILVRFLLLLFLILLSVVLREFNLDST